MYLYLFSKWLQVSFYVNQYFPEVKLTFYHFPSSGALQVDFRVLSFSLDLMLCMDNWVSQLPLLLYTIVLLKHVPS